MSTMHADQKLKFREFADSINAPHTVGDISAINKRLTSSMSGKNHPFSLPSPYPSGVYSASTEFRFQKPDIAPFTIPRTIEGSPILALSTIELDPVERAGRTMHDLEHVIQMLDDGPIETALYTTGTSQHREHEANRITRTLSRSLYRSSTNPVFRRNPVLKK